jgi:hypothetical protein
LIPFILGVEAELVGCFKDNETRAIPNMFSVSSDHGLVQCQAIASAAGYEVFSIQIEVHCFTGPQAHITYDRYGEASNCVDGKGGIWANSVYRIRKGEIWENGSLSLLLSRNDVISLKGG